MIIAQHAVLLPSLEIALIYWPRFLPAFIPALSQAEGTTSPLLPYPYRESICPTTISSHISLTCCFLLSAEETFPSAENLTRSLTIRCS